MAEQVDGSVMKFEEGNKLNLEPGYYWSHPSTDGGKPQGPFDEPLKAVAAGQAVGYRIQPNDLDDDSLLEATAEFDQNPDIGDELGITNR